MARRHQEEEHENHERWLVSYADFITLLFAFFVVMYSLSSVNEERFRVLSDALQAAFRAPPKSMEPMQIGKTAKPEMVQNPVVNRTQARVDQLNGPRPVEEHAAGEGKPMLPEIADRVEQTMAPLIDKKLVSVRRFRFWVEVEINSSVLFPSGSALLATDAIPALRSLARVFRDYSSGISVEGFTDNQPINNYAFPSNWELSTARATSVVHLLTREGIDPARMSVSGYGEYRPKAPNDSEVNRAQNRRIVLVVLGSQAAGRVREAMAGTAEPLPETPAADRQTTDTPVPEKAAAPRQPVPVVGAQSLRPLRPIDTPIRLPGSAGG